MTAVVPATKTAPQMIAAGENHQALLKIKIAGQNFLRSLVFRFRTMKLHHAFLADTRLVPQFRRHLCNQ